MSGSNMAVDVLVRLKDRLSGPLGKLKNALAGFVRFIKTIAIASFAAFTAAITGSITEAIKFQKLWDEANKTLQMTPVQLKHLKKDLDELAVKIPLARHEFVEMAEQAGNIGIRGRENLREFIELAAMMGLTFDGVDPRHAAQFLGNWREALGYTHDELKATADQINYLGNTTNAGAGPLARYASDALALGDAAGYSREETLALGAAVIAAGKAPEVAVTGFRAMNRILTRGADGLTKAQERIVENLGLDMDAIQGQMQTDATGAIRSVVEAINKMPIEKRNSIVTQLFGDEAARVFGPMLTDLSKLERALGRIDDLRNNSAGSAEQEFLGVSDNVVANWRKLRNVISAIRDEAGQPYLEPINNGLKFMMDLLTTLDERVTIFDRISSSVSGFFKGLGFQRLRSGARQFWQALRPVQDFLFGRKGGDPGEQMARIFANAERMGGSLRRAFGGLSNLEPFNTALRGLQSIGEGFQQGFMDNIKEGLSGFDGLSEDISDLGSALGELYQSIRSLFSPIGSDESMDYMKSFGEILGTISAGAVGVAGESLKLTVKLIKGLATALTEVFDVLNGEPFEWGKIAGSGSQILQQLGEWINAILAPLSKLVDMDLTIEWGQLGIPDRVKAWLNNDIDMINGWIDNINALRRSLGMSDLGHIGKFEREKANPVAENDNVKNQVKPAAVSLPGKLNTKSVSNQDRINTAFEAVGANSSSSNNVHKVEFAPLEHEVTSKVEVGGGVQITVTGPGKVTSVTSTNPNAPLTTNTGRAIGRQ